MSNTGSSFRTVTFGGFHKQDVMNYITSASRQHQEQTAALKSQAETAVKERAELAEKLAAAEAQREENAAECRRLSDELNERSRALEAAERELTELRAKSARLAELEEKLPGLERDAAAYVQLKDHTASIEMEARRRAQETIDSAEEHASGVRSELESWMGRVQGSYQHLRADVTATVAHLSGELERGKTALDEMAGAFQQHDEALSAMMRGEGRAAGVPAPQPLPLEEEIQEPAGRAAERAVAETEEPHV